MLSFEVIRLVLEGLRKMAYRIDEEKKFRDEVEHLAAEEEEVELEQIAQDFDLCSRADEAKVRLRTRGFKSTKKELREEAREAVGKLIQGIRDSTKRKKEKRKEIFRKIKKIGGYVTKGAIVTAVLGVSIYTTAYYWNSRDEALEALAKYDKLVKIMDTKEREEVISHLDDIFEEHVYDDNSDEAAAKYLSFIEEKGWTISEGARLLNNIGEWVSLEGYMARNLENSVHQYNLFVETNEVSFEVGECLLKKINASEGDLIIRLDAFYKDGTCKNK